MIKKSNFISTNLSASTILWGHSIKDSLFLYKKMTNWVNVKKWAFFVDFMMDEVWVIIGHKAL